MKTKKFTMAAKLLFLVAIGICVLSLGTASAQFQSGSALLYTYYDVRTAANGGLGLSDNYFTVTNTSTNWVQAHVRVRTGDKSVELLDFDILLSPKDVFTFDMYQGANGGIEFASCDTKTLQNSGFTTTGGCIVMNSVTNTNLLSLIKACQGLDDAGALAATLKGYVEIIGEGRIVPLSTDKNRCASSVTGDARTIPGRTLNQFVRSTDTGATGNNCAIDVRDMPASLEGRLYYVTVDAKATPFVVSRLAMLNAEPMDSQLPLWTTVDAPVSVAAQRVIVHADTYAAEQTRCGTDNGCFAYVAASGTAPTTGADDLNYCFFTDMAGSPSTGVYNKFGAAATFGPTIADLVNRRDGTLPVIQGNLNVFSANFSFAPGALDGAQWIPTPKTFVDSHYFNVPAPLIFDMQTKFAFIFPLQHFIGESDFISAVAAYDNEENTTTITIDKFISPGLPKPGGTPGQEAAIFSFNPPFVEGWVRFSTDGAKNATMDNLCAPGSTITSGTTCVGTVNLLVRKASNAGTYLPAFSGVVYETGVKSLGSALFTYGQSN